MTTTATYNNVKTNIAWMPELPEHWKLSRVKNYFTFSNEVVGVDYSGFNVLSLSVNGVIIRDMESGKGKHSMSMDLYQIVQPKSIILCLFDMDVTPRIVGICENLGIITSAYTTIVPKENVCERFYYYFFLHQDYNKSLKAQGTGVRTTLTNTQFGAVKIPVPPYQEQIQIANYLDTQSQKINHFIAKKQQFIALLKEQKNVVAYDKIFVNGGKENYPNRRIKSISKILRGKFSHRPRNDERLYNGEFPFIQTGEVSQADKYINNYRQTLNEWGYSVSKEFPKGTLCLTIAANVGDVAILNFNACFPDSIIGIVPNPEVGLDYMYFALRSLKAKFISEATLTTQYNLNIERVGPIKIPLPSLEIQESIVAQIEIETATIDTAIAKTEREIELIKEYKEAMIAEAVMGKVNYNKK